MNINTNVDNDGYRVQSQNKMLKFQKIKKKDNIGNGNQTAQVWYSGEGEYAGGRQISGRYGAQRKKYIYDPQTMKQQIQTLK